MNLATIGMLVMTIPIALFGSGLLFASLALIVKDSLRDRDPVAISMVLVMLTTIFGGVLWVVGALLGQRVG